MAVPIAGVVDDLLKRTFRESVREDILDAKTANGRADEGADQAQELYSKLHA